MYDDRRLTGGLGADGRDEAVGKEEAMQKETVYEAVGKEEAMQKEAMPEETVRGKRWCWKRLGQKNPCRENRHRKEQNRKNP